MSYFRTAQDKADFEFVSRLLDQSKKRPLTQDEKAVIGIVARRAPEPIRTQVLAIYDDLMSKGL